ncbi:spore coat protein [Alkaliphilus peptidifermentans]|uniref:Coat F domain-containing protein n=1 Tax=Alkaliphilus peptidifermentans DSM 18978 TaxID=1120976 RepID=A0A1G5HNA0_9FIRM|nr:spore coat protein [Alkaliphilus peptidifermentans]SCY64929.1 Coat F domain-containing protein [Alkaliphilus peptidifermentans DSM 18978]
MQEKDMVNDVLSMINSSLTGYANVISQASNMQLRQELIQIRNRDEQSQYDLYKMAEQKGYYKSAHPAQQNEIQQVKSQFMTPNMP